MNVFDFVNAINFGKQDLFADPQAEKDYVPFIVNRSLSYFADTVLHANAVNTATIPKRWQFDYLRHAIPKRKRFSKWTKNPGYSDVIHAIAEYHGYSLKKSADVIEMLSPEQIEHIVDHVSKGGKTTK